MAYSYIQGKCTYSGSNLATLATSPASTITTGNFVIALLEYSTYTGSAIAISNLTDQSSNVLAFQEVGTGVYSSSLAFGIHLMYLMNAPSGITSVICNTASAANHGLSLSILEYSGIAASAALVGSNGTPASNSVTTAANALNTGSATP